MYEDILHNAKATTLHSKRIVLCKPHLVRMKRNEHKLNTIMPNTRNVPYTLRSFNMSPVSIGTTTAIIHINSIAFLALPKGIKTPHGALVVSQGDSVNLFNSIFSVFG